MGCVCVCVFERRLVGELWVDVSDCEDVQWVYAMVLCRIGIYSQCGGDFLELEM